MTIAFWHFHVEYILIYFFILWKKRLRSYFCKKQNTLPPAKHLGSTAPFHQPKKHPVVPYLNVLHSPHYFLAK